MTKKLGSVAGRSCIVQAASAASAAAVKAAVILIASVSLLPILTRCAPLHKPGDAR
jgi:hypothetical protein